MKKKLSRRALMRLGGATVAATLVCEPAIVSTQATNTIRLAGGNAEVWAWQAEVSGELASAQHCFAVLIEVNGRAVPARLRGSEFSARIPIGEGDNQIVAVCQRANGRKERSPMLTYTGQLRQAPVAVIQPRLDGDQLVLDGAASQPHEPDPALPLNYAWSTQPGNPAPVQLRENAVGKARPFTGEVEARSSYVIAPPVDGEYYFALQVSDARRRSDVSITYVVASSGKWRIPDYDRENPAWVETAIAYGVVPRNFGSDGFQSVIERLDDLQELGINALWLAPVNLSPPGDYGYAVTDYFALNPRYGTAEDFRQLVQEAHRRGIRVLMDFVPNHSSAEHPYFEDALKHGTASRYWNCYDRDEAGIPTHYFDWTHLPNLNYNNPEVEQWMLEAFSYWVREFDVDGFRVDVAWGITERKPAFWPRWRRALKRIKPDLLLLAEASARDPYYFDNGFDAAYDWTAQLGHWAWERVFEDENLLTYNLNAALTNGQRGFHPDVFIFRFLNNNDTGARFITRHGPALTKLATAMLLTLPGIPCLFTGDEVGEAFSPYFDPQPLTWQEQVPGWRDYHKQLIALRKTMPSLHSRHWLPITVEPHQQVYGYVRYNESSAPPVLVLLNFGEEAVEAEIQALPEFPSLFQHPLHNLLADEVVTMQKADPVRIPLSPLGAIILT